jgi:hypothetical protein
MNKKTLLCTLIVSLFAFAQLAMADYYPVAAVGPGPVNAGPYSYGVNGTYGGEFTFTPGGLDISNYVNTTSNQVDVGQYGSTFQTFCLESVVEYNVGQSYYAQLSQYSPMIGGMALTTGAAWLYSQFAQGILSGYDYSTDGGRTTSAGLLQEAIWYLMGQTPPTGFTTATIGNNTFLNQAYTLFGSSMTAASNGQFGVSVLNLYPDQNNTPGTEVQDQLYYGGIGSEGGSPAPTPVPAAVWLLGSGLMGLLGLKRRKG